MSEKLMGTVNNLQQPKQLNRYEILLEDSLRLTAKSISLPKINIGQAELHRMHQLYKVAASKVTYDDITITFYDFVDNKAASSVYAWHQQVYNLGTSLMGFPSQYKRDLTILVYGPDHSVVESWLLVGAWPKDMSRKGLDWTNAGNDTQEITLTLAIDEAQLIVTQA
jgi:hypothetical protein